MSDAIHSPRKEESRVVSFPRPREVDPPDNNLPLQLSSFVGRDAEVAYIGEKLLAGSRIVTLTGAGGSGKTRLALAAAFEVVADFEDGVWWVELAPLSDPALTPRTVASALEVREAAGRSPTEILIEHLKTKKTLLVLDNCEHLIEACAALADSLLRACPGLRILATSREPLGISGESSYPVPPLYMTSKAWRGTERFGCSSSGRGRSFRVSH